MGKTSQRGAALVAAGILLSRLAGLIRQKVFAHLLGNGLEAAAFAAATRIPNVLQNLLGEGVLSASLIPVYAGLRAQGKEADAKRVAGAVFGLLNVVVAAMVAIGVVAAPALVEVIAPGYDGVARDLTVRLVRLIFPGTGVLVLSAWCLGILNSHKRFFLSYVAPVVWNGCIIVALVAASGERQALIVTWASWGMVAGSVAQFAVQLPAVLSILGRFSARPSLEHQGVRQVVRGFVPAVLARGVVQISAWVDVAYASMVSERAVAALTYAQTFAVLPVSLFGMAISAAELPELSAEATRSEHERNDAIRARVGAALQRMSVLVTPSAVAFLVGGDLISAALLESGRFTANDSRYVWYILMGSALGLPAQTAGRLYSSALYALKDTRTPLAFAALRVGCGVALGYYAVNLLPAQLGLPEHLGVVFITATTGLTAWLELVLLRRAVAKRVGAISIPATLRAKVWGAALLAGGLTLLVKLGLGASLGVIALGEWGGTFAPPVEAARLVVSLGLLGLFGAAYLGLAFALKVPLPLPARLRRR